MTQTLGEVSASSGPADQAADLREQLAELRAEIHAKCEQVVVMQKRERGYEQELMLLRRDTEAAGARTRR